MHNIILKVENSMKPSPSLYTLHCQYMYMYIVVEVATRISQ